MDTVKRSSVEPVGQMYDGFISYSHAADDLLAPRLQSALQRFAKPWWKRRAVRIFRDESSLSANPHLWSSITEALDTSGWFVLLLSPDAAESEWVNQEIAYWVANRDPKKILPVVTDGEFGWADGDVDGDAVPDVLRGVFSEEPRWVDVRWAKDEDQLDLKDLRFADAIADIASTIRGVPKDDLASEEVRQHRRTVRTAWAAGAGLLGLAVASTFFGLQAAESARLAEEARENEITNRLASQAPVVFETDPRLGLLLAVEAFNRAENSVTLGGLQRVLVGSRGFLGYVGKDIVYRDLEWIDEQRFLASHTQGVDLIDIDGSVTSLGFSSAASLIELSPDRDVAAVSTAGGVKLIDPLTGESTGVELLQPRVQSVAFSPDGATIASGDLDGNVYFWEVDSGDQIGAPLSAHPETTFEEFDLRLEDVDGIVSHRTETFRIGAVELSFSSDGRRLVTAGMVVARAWDVDSRTQLGEARLEQLGEAGRRPTAALELLQGSSKGPVVIATNGELQEWSPASQATPTLIRSFDSVSGVGMTLALTDVVLTDEIVLFAPAGGRLVGGNPTETGRILELSSPLGGQAHIALSPGGDRVAHAGDGGIAIWSLRGDGPIAVSAADTPGEELMVSTEGDVVVNNLDRPSRLFKLGPAGLTESVASESGRWEWMWIVDDDLFGEEEIGTLEPPWRLDWETLEPSIQLTLSEGNTVYALDRLPTNLMASGGIANRVDITDADGSLLAVLEGLGAPVSSVAFSPDGERVAAADVEGAAQVWDLSTRSPIGPTPLSAGGGQVIIVNYDPSGRRLVTVSQDGTIVIRDSETLQPKAVLEGGSGLAANVSFGPFFQGNDRYMITTADGPGRLWDLEELVQVGGTFPNDSDALANASVDGRWLVTVTQGDLVVWDLDTSVWAERACRAAGRNLTQDEWNQFIGQGTPYRTTCPMWEMANQDRENVDD